MSDRIPYTGVSHTAMVCSDMAKTVDFFCNTLDMPLVKTAILPDGSGELFFFDCGGGDTISYMWFPDAPPAAPGIASQHKDIYKDGSQTAIASMNHLAITVPLEIFDTTVERLRARGVKCSVWNQGEAPQPTPEPTADTWVRSVYFHDPDGAKLEICAFTRRFNASDVKHRPAGAR